MLQPNPGDRRVVVQGLIKGVVYKERGRWRWCSLGRGTETFMRSARLKDVRVAIARLCRVDPSLVEIGRAEP